MDNASHWKTLLKSIHLNLKAEHEPPAKSLKAILSKEDPADIALALEDLDPDQAKKVFAALGRGRSATVLGLLEPELAKSLSGDLGRKQFDQVIDELPKREEAVLLSQQSARTIRRKGKAGLVSAEVAKDADQRSHYPVGSAGRLMTTEFVRLHADMTVTQALNEVRRTDPAQDLPDDMCVVESDHGSKPGKDRLVGVLSIRDAVMASPRRRVGDVMSARVVCVTAETESTDAARLLSKHKFLSLPVADADGHLLGLIPSEDLMQVTLAQLHSRYARSVGTDAAAMERMSPLQAATRRTPWLLGTMGIELGAAVIVSHFSPILEKVILLASFMPVVSAVSGNVGLQAAAITVRALDTGQTSLTAAGVALLKEGMTTIIMALICGTALGLIGGFWSRHLVFGVVIGFALTCSMLTAAFMGTLFPMISKKLGFDPATTAGPFETAFQDVVGFAVFLGLATAFASRL